MYIIDNNIITHIHRSNVSNLDIDSGKKHTAKQVERQSFSVTYSGKQVDTEHLLLIF